MRVHLGSDHAGFELKQYLASRLVDGGHDVVDHGPSVFDPDDDYPTFCLRAGLGVVNEQDSLGVVLGGSGNGEQIAANKVRGVRAALAWSEETARLAREHNDANVLAIGSRMHTPEEAGRFVEVFLTTAFTGLDRHRRRIAMLAGYEDHETLPPLPPSA